MGPDSLSNDDNAVSPVIGVVLLFAISVALAAVTAGVVVGTDNLIQTNPQRRSTSATSPAPRGVRTSPEAVTPAR